MALHTEESSLWGSFVSNVKNRFRTKAVVGESWQGWQASEAFRNGKLKSKTGGRSIRIAFRNLSPLPLLLCWVSEDCQLYHFRLLPRQRTATQSPVSIDDHIENSSSGHAFCLVHLPEEEVEEAKQTKSVKDTSSIIGGFLGFLPKHEQDNPIYLVTISQEDDETGDDMICCQPRILFFKKRKRNNAPFENLVGTYKRNSFAIRHRLATEVDPTPYDTSTKFYERKLLGGWPVYLEPNWHMGDLEIEKRLGQDLKCAAEILPKHAVDYLKAKCPIWVNSSIKYGPKACPIQGRGCCYHPDKEWLIENGLCANKAKCVEINDGPGYIKDINLWGPGGVMVHELSHAYHHRIIQDGYKNKEIEECYKAAMKEGLYECVKVHGPQGPETRAYACSNCMEYFAELSTAFLGGTQQDQEYNKWYPFNRQQIKEHDPRAFKLLSRLWKMDNP